MEIETAWVKPPPQVGGLDHLAVQAPCINIYGRLLPGITNVTDRARYYSFYPWVIWAFDKQGYTKYDNEFIERFRRADCLFSLISERHAATAGGDYNDHAGAMVGSNTLASVARELAEGGSVVLSQYSLREGAKSRYFLNKLGGLGQYYLGVLRELAILDGDSTNGIKYTRQIGQVIAEHMDAGFNGDLFLTAVEADSVTAEQLDELSALCPCQLSKNSGEKEILSDLFFVRGVFHDIEAMPRRRTLQSVLQLAGLLTEEEHELNETVFRACVYAGALPSGKAWVPSESLVGNREKWATYARNEYLSIAVQGLFFALLDAYEESGLRYDSNAQVVDWFVGQPEVLETLSEFGAQEHFSTCVKDSASWLPSRANWTMPAHESELVEHIARLSRGSKSMENRREIIAAALRTLIALASRTSNLTNSYGEIAFDDRYFNYYPINLRSFDYHLINSWSSLSLQDTLRWLLLNWGIDTHLRVALRKLRGQSQSTFRIRPSDRGLEVMDVPTAAHTRPRFNQAVRVLKDIGALEKTESGFWQPSGLGISMLELGDAP